MNTSVTNSNGISADVYSINTFEVDKSINIVYCIKKKDDNLYFPNAEEGNVYVKVSFNPCREIYQIDAQGNQIDIVVRSGKEDVIKYNQSESGVMVLDTVKVSSVTIKDTGNGLFIRINERNSVPPMIL